MLDGIEQLFFVSVIFIAGVLSEIPFVALRLGMIDFRMCA
jgi:hypothetical protein